MPIDELQIVAPLVGRGIIPKDAANECLGMWTTLKRQHPDVNVSLLKVMVKKGVLTRTQAMVLAGELLAERQPFLPSYKIVRHVGEGGMANVYEATFLEVAARVALKVLKTEFCLQEAFRLRFKREAQILLALDHENIVQGREYATHDGVDFYAMAFVDGISVLSILESGVALAEGMAVHIASQVADALEHMRQKGIVHRDVKPGNLVIDPEGTVRIIDFGLAKVMTGMRQDVGAETTVGTIEYMSPEQCKGESAIDARADVYSLGVTLFQMATGELPFAGDQTEVMFGHVKKPLEFTAAQRAKISAPTIFILRKSMAKDPAHRYQTPQEMSEDLKTLCAPLIVARGPVPDLVHEASVEEAPIQIPAPAPIPPPRVNRETHPSRPLRRRPRR